MARKARPIKRYKDPYGKNIPLKVGQRRCTNKRCNAAVWFTTWIQYGGKCPCCADDARIKEETKNWEIAL